MTTHPDHPTLGVFEAQFQDGLGIFDSSRRTLTIYADGIRVQEGKKVVELGHDQYRVEFPSSPYEGFHHYLLDEHNNGYVLGPYRGYQDLVARLEAHTTTQHPLLGRLFSRYNRNRPTADGVQQLDYFENGIQITYPTETVTLQWSQVVAQFGDAEDQVLDVTGRVHDLSAVRAGRNFPTFDIPDPVPMPATPSPDIAEYLPHPTLGAFVNASQRQRGLLGRWLQQNESVAVYLYRDGVRLNYPNETLDLVWDAVTAPEGFPMGVQVRFFKTALTDQNGRIHTVRGTIALQMLGLLLIHLAVKHSPVHPPEGSDDDPT